MKSIIGVCGFGRCGSTMAMKMLDAGGIPPVEGSQKVSYELGGLSDGELDGVDLEGHAVKLLDAVLHIQLPKVDWQFIWLDRDLSEQVTSQIKFVTTVLGPMVRASTSKFIASYKRDRPVAMAGLKTYGPVYVMRYEDVLRAPLACAQRLSGFLGGDFDPAAAAAAVHRRDGKCRPDLSFEITGVFGNDTTTPVPRSILRADD